MFEIDTDTKVQMAVYEFENNIGIRPNKIIMGYHLADELRNKYYTDCVPIESLGKIAEVMKLGIKCEYEGIPVKVDYDNPDNLEVGYMVKWFESKY